MNVIPEEFIDTLNWVNFVVPPRPDIPPGVSPKGTRTQEQETLLDAYHRELRIWHDRVEIVTRAGTVLRLSSGAHVLVGHVNESLSAVDEVGMIDLEDICAVAVLW